MIVAVFTFVVMLTAVAAMALGVMITGRRLKGSCGGVGGGGDCLCDKEGRPRECEKAPQGEPPLAQLPSSRASTDGRPAS